MGKLRMMAMVGALALVGAGCLKQEGAVGGRAEARSASGVASVAPGARAAEFVIASGVARSRSYRVQATLSGEAQRQ